ncbi:medium chain dehydrogenase/reductase family protein [Hymenobacter sp. GOD-10R]|uniref:medium chain dehydrogenase/reductase family protein n=1 Tax=Hymenobacter sp. GOD-10R TaxID=3093922 RepID=UPI002D78BDC9|nr:medium chain dehydrogenase/reductase family protein [Hymenobacter sp. GOD-10R]WRQ27067.1 medium chain dehydrogenase/reductase family protein [Hymenobacter sp. GOD-10R]
MQAAILEAFGTPLLLQELADPRPLAGEVVVDVVAAPVLPYAAEVFSGARQYPLLLPLAVGSGAVGRVRSVGPDTTRLAPGDWVYCDPTVRARDEPVAPDILLQGLIAPSPGAQRLQAHFRHGPFAEQLLLPLENAIPLGALEPAEAARWCGLGLCLVPYGGLLAADLQAGETILISGATGHFGSAAVAVALAMGAGCVIAPGRNEAVLADLVRRFGSRVRPVRLSGDENEDQRRMQRAAPGRIDKVLDLLPPLPDAAPVRAAAQTVRPHGTVVLMGGLRVGLELNYAHLMRHCITVRGQYMYPRQAPAQLIALIRAGLLSLDEWKITTFSLSQVNAAVAHTAHTGEAFQSTILLPGDVAFK